MRRAQGYATWVGGGTQDHVERDTFTCAHCNVVVFVDPKPSAQSQLGYCRPCMKPICKPCTGKGCRPFEAKLATMEARDRFLRSAGI